MLCSAPIARLHLAVHCYFTLFRIKDPQTSIRGLLRSTMLFALLLQPSLFACMSSVAGNTRLTLQLMPAVHAVL